MEDLSGLNSESGLRMSNGIVNNPLSGLANGAMTKPFANPLRSRSAPPEMTSEVLGSLYLNLFTEKFEGFRPFYFDVYEISRFSV